MELSLASLLLLLAAALTALVIVLWWLLVITEGVYLGRGVVIALYDLYARRYDAIKQYDPENESRYLARPILESLPTRAPLVLDVATGTGRLPLALLAEPNFQGRIVALDLSRRMLAVAAEKLAPYGERVTLLHHTAERLPFSDGAFDLVTCLEALEFMPRPRPVLAELVRVLRAGGLLLLTNRQGRDAHLMPGHAWADAKLERHLRALGMVYVAIRPWQLDYSLVWALKAGHSAIRGARPPEEVWRCPACDAAELLPVAEGWRCLACEAFVPRAADGVAELHGRKWRMLK